MGRSKSPRARAFESIRRLISQRFSEDDSFDTILHFNDPAKATEYVDRAAALVATTMVEQALETAILSHFINLSESERSELFWSDKDAPLASFSSRIRIGYALGVFGPRVRDELTCIRNIRNVFAHSIAHITFDSNEIRPACDQLNYPQFFKFAFTQIFQTPDTPKEKFLVTCQLVTMYLFTRPGDQPKKYSRSQDSWGFLEEPQAWLEKYR